MDGGYIAGIVETGVLVYWMVVGWIAIRRRNALAKYDVVLIRHGYLLFSGVAILVFVGIVALGGK